MNISIKTVPLAGIILFSLMSQSVSADSELKTNKQKYSYAIGIQVANNLKNQNVKLDPESLSQAIKENEAYRMGGTKA